MVPHGATRVPLVIAQHGGGGVFLKYAANFYDISSGVLNKI